LDCGLGNQLFQLAAALEYTDGPVNIVTALGNPRSSADFSADILGFVLPSRVQVFATGRVWNVSKKATGYILRLGISPTAIERSFMVSKIAPFICSILLSLNFLKIVPVSMAQGVGYFLREDRKRHLLVGYFQSYKWASKPNVLNELKKIFPKEEDEYLTMLESVSLVERPLVVHVRLGDYLLEPNFGTPDKIYYQRGIECQLATGKFNKIWLFSNEIEASLEFIPEKYRSILRVVDKPGLLPTQVLQAMRFGHGYVIANSTYSWWGAFLSYSSNPPVVAPWPWFRGMESPLDLLPPHWRIIPLRTEAL
jgi:hypothetical protein